jgi:hypothetical protein
MCPVFIFQITTVNLFRPGLFRVRELVVSVVSFQITSV